MCDDVGVLYIRYISIAIRIDPLSDGASKPLVNELLTGSILKSKS